jgi:hypothetical protein
MAELKRSIALVLAVLGVMIGIAFATEPTLNRNEPHCRYWSDVSVFGCAEHGEPSAPTFLVTVRPSR